MSNCFQHHAIQYANYQAPNNYVCSARGKPTWFWDFWASQVVRISGSPSNCSKTLFIPVTIYSPSTYIIISWYSWSSSSSLLASLIILMRILMQICLLGIPTAARNWLATICVAKMAAHERFLPPRARPTRRICSARPRSLGKSAGIVSKRTLDHVSYTEMGGQRWVELFSWDLIFLLCVFKLSLLDDQHNATSLPNSRRWWCKKTNFLQGGDTNTYFLGPGRQQARARMIFCEINSWHIPPPPTWLPGAQLVTLNNGLEA